MAPATFDWVTARKKCNVREMFKRLAEVVEADITIAKDGEGFEHLKFDRISELHFAVDSLHSSGLGRLWTVHFRLKASRIIICSGDHELFSTRVYLRDGGDCTFEVKDRPLKAWQISRLALEDAMFPTS